MVILKEALADFEGKKILEATGNSKIDKSLLINRKVNFKTWGKHFLVCLPKNTLRVHFLMFGSYSINEQTKPDSRLRLSLRFKNGSVYFYSCAIKFLEDDPDNVYDWSADVMNENWDATKARKKLKAMPGTLVCDVLLDQKVFSGVGNIIKNEVLYRTKIHPETPTGNLPPRKLMQMIKEARQYSFDFFEWKKIFQLKKHWLAHTKKKCLRCNLPIIKKYTGKTKRRSFFCENCQVLYV